MKPYQINLINAVILILLSLWGYLSSNSPSATALIPVAFGVVLAALTPWFSKGNKVVAHIAVTVTLILFVSLMKPLSGALDRADSAAIFRVVLMLLSSFVALVVFVRSFVMARLKK